MKKNLSPQEIIRLHIESDLIIDSVAMTGDYKTNNREFKKIDKLFNILQENPIIAKEVYSQLLGNDCITTRINSAAACLKLGIYVDQAVQVLEEIAKRNDIGIRRLNAEMVLRVWRGEVPGKTL